MGTQKAKPIPAEVDFRDRREGTWWIARCKRCGTVVLRGYADGLTHLLELRLLDEQQEAAAHLAGRDTFQVIEPAPRAGAAYLTWRHPATTMRNGYTRRGWIVPRHECSETKP
jgi:hypothetical protein